MKNRNYSCMKILKIFCLSFVTVLFIGFILWFKTNYTVSYVPTNSMEPFIMSKSIVLIENHPDMYETGDIAVYDRGDIKVIHRIVEITDDGTYIFKGDNNSVSDADPVESTQLLGKYVWHSEFLGKYYRNLMIILYIPIVIEIVLFVFRRISKLRRNKKQNEDKSN